MQADPNRPDDSIAEGDAEPQAAGGEPVFNIAPVVLVLIAANFAVHGVRTYLLSPAQDLSVLLATAFIPARYGPLGGGFDLPWLTTPFTYAFLHGGMAHLGFNMIWLAIFGSPLAARIGTGRFLAFYFGAVLAAVAAHLVIHSGSVAMLVGASGGVSGVTGAAARFAFRVSRDHGIRSFEGRLMPVTVALRIPTVLAFCAVWMVLNAATGAGLLAPDGSNNIAWEAHVGGFLFGFLLVGLFDRRH